MRAVLAAHPAVSIPVTIVLVLMVWLGVNWTYHVIRKPSEVLFPLDSAFDKNFAQTWRESRPALSQHATAVITPELLAALAQVEETATPSRERTGAGARRGILSNGTTASSAVGMYQITCGTFQAARRYCIHDHVVAEDGPWHDVRSCWFNRLYTRVLPQSCD